MEHGKAKATLAQRWSDTRPTKAVTAWFCAGSIAATMIVGFTWGGWVTGSTALRMAEAHGAEAVVKRLAPMCVGQFEADAKKGEKLTTLKAMDSWRRSDYVIAQGWATLPGAADADSDVATECVKLLMASAK